MKSSTKDEILTLLLKQNGEPLSGQKIADDLGVSRTAIWKHMQTLQQEGFVIDTVKKHGYILHSGAFEQLTQAEVTSFLKTKEFGRTLHLYDEVESTQLIAHSLVAEGAAGGTVVVAEAQTAGRGRMMREWDSTRKKGLWFTVIVRPDCLPHEAPQFTLIAAVAVVNAVKSLYPQLNPQIKWPNDILINGRKCTGILTEMISETDRIRALLIGIGINVNQLQDDFPEGIQGIATSLKMAMSDAGENVEINRAELLAEILLYLENYSELYLKHGFARIKPMWEEASCTIGNQVRATTLREVIVGKALAITDSGVLQIEKDDGTIASVYSADIELLARE